jgi:hypothetical protein
MSTNNLPVPLKVCPSRLVELVQSGIKGKRPEPACNSAAFDDELTREGRRRLQRDSHPIRVAICPFGSRSLSFDKSTLASQLTIRLRRRRTSARPE